MDSDAVGDIARQWTEQRPDLDPSPMLVVGRIGRLAAILDRHLRPAFAAEELGDGDFDVLAALRRSGRPYTLSPGALSRAMIVTTGAVTKRVDRLESRGLVRRAVSDGDRRGRTITLTAAGVRLVDRLIEQHLATERELIAGLAERDRVRLAELLGSLATDLETR